MFKEQNFQNPINTVQNCTIIFPLHTGITLHLSPTRRNGRPLRHDPQRALERAQLHCSHRHQGRLVRDVQRDGGPVDRSDRTTESERGRPGGRRVHDDRAEAGRCGFHLADNAVAESSLHQAAGWFGVAVVGVF